MFILITLLILAYLIGSIPTGYWLSKYWFGIDITHHGSGNIGATNVARVLGKRYFLPIFLIDAAKAYLVLLSSLVLRVSQENHHTFLYLLAIALLIGNAHSVFLKFKGGKGVATALGIIFFMASWYLSLMCMIIWLLVTYITKKPFIASLLSMLCITGVMLYENSMHSPFFLAMFCWIVWRHRSNVNRSFLPTLRQIQE